MKSKIHKIKYLNTEISLNLMTFDEKDKKVFKRTFNLWKQLNKIVTTKLRGTRNLNLPDALSESIVCQELGFGKLLGATVKGSIKYSTSYDAFDFKNNKRIQVKCSTSTGPSSFEIDIKELLLEFISLFKALV